MPDIYPRRVWPVLPDEAAGQYLAPASGAFLAAVYDYECHLALIRHLGRPQVDKVWDYAADPLTSSPVTLAQDVMLRLRAHPLAAHVFVGVQYQASPFGVSAPDLVALGSPPVLRIVATLLDHATAAAIDSPGMRWDYQDGTLTPTVRVGEVDWVEGVVNPPFGSTTYPPRWVVSGVAANDAPGVAVTRPRPLNIGSAAPTLLRIRLQTTNVRILRACAWIMPEQVVPV